MFDWQIGMQRMQQRMLMCVHCTFVWWPSKGVAISVCASPSCKQGRWFRWYVCERSCILLKSHIFFECGRISQNCNNKPISFHFPYPPPLLPLSLHPASRAIPLWLCHNLQMPCSGDRAFLPGVTWAKEFGGDREGFAQTPTQKEENIRQIANRSAYNRRTED